MRPAKRPHRKPFLAGMNYFGGDSFLLGAAPTATSQNFGACAECGCKEGTRGRIGKDQPTGRGT